MRIFKNPVITGILLAAAVVVLATLALKSVYKAFAKAPEKSPAVLSLEADMAEMVPAYNLIALPLKQDRTALKALGYCFNDTTLKAEACPF